MTVRFVGVSFFVACCMILAMACEANDLRTVGEVKDFIRKNLPLGSDRSRVVQVLTDKGIENSGLKAQSGIVYAIIRNTSGGPLIRGSVAMEFFFDEGDRLARSEVQEILTGP